eukprot:4234190-Pleurochrysis_carterae.AAC.1
MMTGLVCTTQTAKGEIAARAIRQVLPATKYARAHDAVAGMKYLMRSTREFASCKCWCCLAVAVHAERLYTPSFKTVPSITMPCMRYMHVFMQYAKTVPLEGHPCQSLSVRSVGKFMDRSLQRG